MMVERTGAGQTRREGAGTLAQQVEFGCGPQQTKPRGVFAVFGGGEGWDWRCTRLDCAAGGSQYSGAQTAAVALGRHLRQAHPEAA